MKNAIRVISLVLMAVLLSMMLCSCIQLDDLKTNRAVFLNDEKTEILFRDNVYRRLLLKGDAIIENESYDGRLTTPDVPVLIAAVEGSELSFDKEADVPVILKQYYDHYSKVTDDYVYGTVYYCLESEYDKIADIDRNGIYDSMYIRYEKGYNVNDGVSYDYRMICEIISEEYQDAINRTLESTEETFFDEDADVGMEYLDIARCDSEMLLTSNVWIQIIRCDGEYYVNENNHSFKKAADSDKEVFRRLFIEYDEKHIVYSNVYPEMIEGY